MDKSFEYELCDHPLYSVWSSMKSRCKSNYYANEYWNGRGITICNEWQEFIPFFNWAMENGYKKGLTLDRIDNDGNYCPENCRFTTYSIQNSNRRKFQRMTRIEI